VLKNHNYILKYKQINLQWNQYLMTSNGLNGLGCISLNLYCF